MRNNKRGMSTGLTIVLVILALAVVGGAVWGAYNAGYLSSTATPVRTAVTTEFDGIVDDVVVPEDVSGTDLVAGQAYAITSDVWNASFANNVDINGTDGTTHYLAFRFEIDGNGVSDFEADGALNLLVTEAVIRDVYVMYDQEGLTLDKSNHISSFGVDLETELDEFTVESDVAQEGDYIMVVELKALTTVTVGTETMVTINFDYNTEEDEDSGIVYLTNP